MRSNALHVTAAMHRETSLPSMTLGLRMPSQHANAVDGTEHSSKTWDRLEEHYMAAVTVSCCPKHMLTEGDSGTRYAIDPYYFGQCHVLSRIAARNNTYWAHAYLTACTPAYMSQAALKHISL